jgi:hypothetical protein
VHGKGFACERFSTARVPRTNRRRPGSIDQPTATIAEIVAGSVCGSFGPCCWQSIRKDGKWPHEERPRPLCESKRQPVLLATSWDVLLGLQWPRLSSGVLLDQPVGLWLSLLVHKRSRDFVLDLLRLQPSPERDSAVRGGLRLLLRGTDLGSSRIGHPGSPHIRGGEAQRSLPLLLPYLLLATRSR